MEQQLNKPKQMDSTGGLASTATAPALGKLPDGGSQFTPDTKGKTEANPTKYVNNGLASMFGVMGQNPQGIGLPTQQPMFSGYKNMWQPNMGANYQVIGGVGNII